MDLIDNGRLGPTFGDAWSKIADSLSATSGRRHSSARAVSMRTIWRPRM